jgi:hypothetical protein
MLSVIGRAGVVSRVAVVAGSPAAFVGDIEAIDSDLWDAGLLAQEGLDHLMHADQELVAPVAHPRDGDVQPVGLDLPVAGRPVTLMVHRLDDNFQRPVIVMAGLGMRCGCEQQCREEGGWQRFAHETVRSLLAFGAGVILCGGARELILEGLVCPHIVGIFAPHRSSFLDWDFSSARASGVQLPITGVIGALPETAEPGHVLEGEEPGAWRSGLGTDALIGTERAGRRRARRIAVRGKPPGLQAIGRENWHPRGICGHFLGIFAAPCARDRVREGALDGVTYAWKS